MLVRAPALETAWCWPICQHMLDRSPQTHPPRRCPDPHSPPTCLYLADTPRPRWCPAPMAHPPDTSSKTPRPLDSTPPPQPTHQLPPQRRPAPCWRPLPPTAHPPAASQHPATASQTPCPHCPPTSHILADILPPMAHPSLQQSGTSTFCVFVLYGGVGAVRRLLGTHRDKAGQDVASTDGGGALPRLRAPTPESPGQGRSFLLAPRGY